MATLTVPGLWYTYGVGAGLADPALVHDHDISSDHQGFGRFRRGVDHDGLPLGENVLQLFSQLFSELVVQIDQRFVEQQQPGVLDQRAGDGGALLLAAGKLRREPVEKFFQVKKLRRFAHPAVDLFFFHAAHFQRRRDIFVDGEGGIVDELLIDHGHFSFSNRHVRNIDPVHQDPSPRGLVQPGHDAQKRGLSRQGPAQDHVSRTGLEFEIDFAQMGFPPDFLVDFLKGQAHSSAPWDSDERPYAEQRPWGLLNLAPSFVAFADVSAFDTGFFRDASVRCVLNRNDVT